eukprot:tig00000478_g1279.t1
MVYHSSFNAVQAKQACGCLLLPLKLGNSVVVKSGQRANIADPDKPDIIDEAIDLFRPNIMFRTFSIEGPADRLLMYLTLFINICLKKMEGCDTKDKAHKAVNVFALQEFPIPGQPGFPFGGLFSDPADPAEGDLFREYARQVRQECSRRVADLVFATGQPNKHWMAFSKKKFMNKTAI